MESGIDYTEVMKRLEIKGRELYGREFCIAPADSPALYRLISYFLKDVATAQKLDINLNKGILITGPVGCGKTSLMNLMRFLQPVPVRFIMRPCREISFEFIKNGYPIIQKYSHLSFSNHQPKSYCFDDLGAENNIKFFGNECNVMAEILLSRHDLFVNQKMLTHLTTNLSASEIGAAYGNRVRSRMRELFNLVVMTSPDKRR